MIDLTALNNNRRVSLILHKRNVVESYELTGEYNVVNEINIEEQIENPLIEMQIKMRKSPNWQQIIEVGDIIIFYETTINLDYEIRTRKKQTYFVMQIDDEINQYERVVTCRNQGHHLERNKYYLKVNSNETASQFIKRTAREKDISIERVDNSSYRHEAKVLNYTSLQRAWKSLIATTMYQEELRYNMRFGTRGFIFERIEQPDKIWTFEVTNQYNNIMDASRVVSIIDPDFINIARAIKINESESSRLRLSSSSEPEIVAQAINQNSVDRYGEFPTDINVTNYGKPDEIRNRLQQIVSEGLPTDIISFKTFTLGSLKPSDWIIIYYPYMDTAGVYFIEHLRSNYKDREYWSYIKARKRLDIQSDLVSRLELGNPLSIGRLRIPDA